MTFTVAELRKMKAEKYAQARESGVLSQLADVARELGRDPATTPDEPFMRSTYGPKYKWEADGIEIYVDDYGRYMTVHVNGQEACSTHPTDQFFVAGEWVNKVLSHHDEAARRIEQRRADREEAERQKLASQLQLS